MGHIISNDTERRFKRYLPPRVKIPNLMVVSVSDFKSPDNKLSRKMAILEFSSSNGFASFSLNFECRFNIITAKEDENNYQFSYLVSLPDDLRSDTSACDERGLEQWVKPGYEYINCITNFQGKKCSMNHRL